jgi:hypothetical protein
MRNTSMMPRSMMLLRIDLVLGHPGFFQPALGEFLEGLGL